MNNFLVPRNIMWAGIVLIALIGLIHLVEAPEYFEVATYVGVLFLANAAGAALSGYGIYRGGGWGWALGALMAVGAFVAYIVSRAVGLPGAPGLAQEEFFEPLGVVSLLLEGLFLALYATWASRPTQVPRTARNRTIA